MSLFSWNKSLKGIGVDHKTKRRRRRDGRQMEEGEDQWEIVERVNMAEQSFDLLPRVPVEVPLFIANPKKVVFQKYEPYQVKEAVIRLKNVDAVPRRVKVENMKSEYFTVKRVWSTEGMQKGDLHEKVSGSKVAPGMDVKIIVVFTPKKVMDYSDFITIVTEREKYRIKVVANGYRPHCEFPKSIDFGGVVVKGETHKTVYTRNQGRAAAKVTCTTDGSPFQVYPTQAIIPVRESLAMHCSFCPQESREYNGRIFVNFDNGDQKIIPCIGRAECAEIYLSSQIVSIEPAYISLSNQVIVKIVNRSDVPVRYEWKSYQSSRLLQCEIFFKAFPS